MLPPELALIIGKMDGMPCTAQDSGSTGDEVPLTADGFPDWSALDNTVDEHFVDESDDDTVVFLSRTCRCKECVQ